MISVAEVQRIEKAFELKQKPQWWAIAKASFGTNPTHDRVLAFPLPIVSPTAMRAGEDWDGVSRIETMDQEDPPQYFVALAVGPGAEKATDHGRLRIAEDAANIPNRYTMPVNDCDVFIAGRYSGEQLNVDGFEFRLIKSTDILAVIDVAVRIEVRAEEEAAAILPEPGAE